MRKRPVVAPTNRVIPYLRQSLARPGETRSDSLSLDAQEMRIRDWAERRGYTLLPAVRDHDLTGDNPDRPGLAELRALARPGDVIAVHMFDRFARDLLLQEQLVRGFNAAGIEVVSISQPSDPLSRQMHGAFSEYFSRQLSERLTTVVTQRAARGEHLGATPYGYRRPAYTDPEGRVRGRGPLEPDPVEAPIVAELFARRAAGDSLAALAAWLTATAKPRRAAHWSDASIGWILRNPMYAGGILLNGELSWNGTHPPLIDRAIWEAVQARRTGFRPRRLDRLHWAEGLVRHSCGWAMTCQQVGRPGGWKPYATYRCEGRGNRCHQPRALIGAPVLDRAVRQALAADLAVLLSVPDAIAHADAALADPAARAEAERLRRDRSRLVTRLDRARQLWLAGEDPIERFQQERATIQTQLAALDAQLAAYPTVPDPAELLTAAELLATIPALLPTITDATLRALITDLGTIQITAAGLTLAYAAAIRPLIPAPTTIALPLGRNGVGKL